MHVLRSGLEFLAMKFTDRPLKTNGQTDRWINERRSEKLTWALSFQQWVKKQDLNIIIPKYQRKSSYFGIKAGNVPHNKETKLRWKREILPAQISDQMDKIISITPSTANSQVHICNGRVTRELPSPSPEEVNWRRPSKESEWLIYQNS